MFNLKSENGQALVEYVFIIALVVIVLIIVVALFGEQLLQMYQDIFDKV